MLNPGWFFFPSDLLFSQSIANIYLLGYFCCYKLPSYKNLHIISRGSFFKSFRLLSTVLFLLSCLKHKVWFQERRTRSFREHICTYISMSGNSNDLKQHRVQGPGLHSEHIYIFLPPTIRLWAPWGGGLCLTHLRAPVSTISGIEQPFCNTCWISKLGHTAS